jgi:hypothetical protein
MTHSRHKHKGAISVSGQGIMACAGFCFALVLPAQAQELENPLEDLRDTTELSSEYGGVVTRQVVTSMGQLFHAKFTELWQTKENFEKFNILVKERPYPRGGTEVQVLYADQVMFRRYLPRDARALAKLSEDAAEAVYARASEFDIQRLLFSDEDLAPSGY